MFNLIHADDRYPNKSDAELRIHNSIVRYKDRYYWCSANSGDPQNTVHLRDPRQLASSNGITIDANSPDLDVRSPELGWVFTGSGVGMFIARAPLRKQKQGIAPDNLVYYYADPQKNPKNGSRITSEHIYNADFFNMIDRPPQSFTSALDQANTVKKSCCGAPLSRLHALIWNNNKQLEVYKRLSAIGLVTDGSVTLYPAFNNSLNVMTLTNMGVPLTS